MRRLPPPPLPLSGCHVLFVSWGRLSGNGAKRLSRLAGKQGRLGYQEAVAYAHMGEKKAGESASGNGRRRRSRREMHAFSHVFDMGVFPTGVKKGRADWAE